jgi:hypothetical protein
MSLKFSGTCYLRIEDHEIIEYIDYDIITQENWMEDDVEFDYNIFNQLKSNEKLKLLNDGTYYIYFYGDAEFGENYCYDYACYEAWSEYDLEEVFYQKVDDEYGIKDVDEKTIS